MEDHEVVASAAADAAASVRATDIMELLGLLVATASPNGGEAAATQALADHLTSALPEATVTVDRFRGERANLLVELGDASGPGLGVYGHLDTSLLGNPSTDRAITGRDDEPAALAVIDGDVVGHGVAVARGSVAAGLVAAIAAHRALARASQPHRIQILLASGGTHRLPPTEPGAGRATFGPGVRRALAQGWAPKAVLNVKAGAPAPLLEEPGAAYLTIEVRGTWDPVLFRDDDPGTLAALGPLASAIERSRERWRSLPLPAGTVTGRELALGALRAGDLTKSDLLPALLEASAFAVLAPGDDPELVAGIVRDHLQRSFAAAGINRLEATVTVAAADLSVPGTATDPDSPLARRIHQAWTDRFGPPPAVTDWRGSTDSVVLRAAGIPTVRCGPLVGRDEADARLDRMPLADLEAFARLWAEVIADQAVEGR